MKLHEKQEQLQEQLDEKDTLINENATEIGELKNELHKARKDLAREEAKYEEAKRYTDSQRATSERLVKQNEDILNLMEEMEATHQAEQDNTKKNSQSDRQYANEILQLAQQLDKKTEEIERLKRLTKQKDLIPLQTKPPPTDKNKWFYVKKEGGIGQVNIDDGRMGLGFGTLKIKGLYESMEELCRPLHIVSQGCKTAVDRAQYESVPRSQIRYQVIYGKSVYILTGLERYLRDLFGNSGFEPNAPYLAYAHGGMLVEETENRIKDVKRMYSMCHKIKEVFNRLAPGDPFYEPFIVNNAYRHQEIHNLLTRNHTHLAKMDEKQLQVLVESIQKIKQDEKPEERNQTETKIKICIHERLAELETEEQKREDFKKCVDDDASGSAAAKNTAAKEAWAAAAKKAAAEEAAAKKAAAERVDAEITAKKLFKAFTVSKDGTNNVTLTSESIPLWNKKNKKVTSEIVKGKYVYIRTQKDYDSIEGPFIAQEIDFGTHVIILKDDTDIRRRIPLEDVYASLSEENWASAKAEENWTRVVSNCVKQFQERNGRAVKERHDQKVKAMYHWNNFARKRKRIMDDTTKKEIAALNVQRAQSNQYPNGPYLQVFDAENHKWSSHALNFFNISQDGTDNNFFNEEILNKLKGANLYVFRRNSTYPDQKEKSVYTGPFRFSGKQADFVRLDTYDPLRMKVTALDTTNWPKWWILPEDKSFVSLDSIYLHTGKYVKAFDVSETAPKIQMTEEAQKCWHAAGFKPSSDLTVVLQKQVYILKTEKQEDIVQYSDVMGPCIAGPLETDKLMLNVKNCDDLEDKYHVNRIYIKQAAQPSPPAPAPAATALSAESLPLSDDSPPPEVSDRSTSRRPHNRPRGRASLPVADIPFGAQPGEQNAPGNVTSFAHTQNDLTKQFKEETNVGGVGRVRLVRLAAPQPVCFTVLAVD